MRLKVLPHPDSKWYSAMVIVLSVTGVFITYFSMYAFRKPFTAGVYPEMMLWGFDYKIVLLISQVAGYTVSKFLGIKVVAELKPSARIKYILGLIGVSWIALFFFGLVPSPYNFVFLFFNGLPLGMIWGIVFAFIEGRMQTELLAAGMASSFIVSSGFVKSVGRALVLDGISEFWMPFLTGLIFIPPLLLGVWILSKLPPPTKNDELARTERAPMLRKDRARFFYAFAPGIIIVTIIYMALNAYRDFRDNFAVEIWNSFGFSEQPEILAYSEIPIAILVLVISGSMILIKNNRRAFYVNFYIIGFGGALLFITTLFFQSGRLNPALWMILVGFGMYLPYIFYHTMLFERWIALFRYRSNIGFLMYICDSFGYLSSVGILLYKDLFDHEIRWVDFFVNISLVFGLLSLGLSLIGGLYFIYKEKKGLIPKPYRSQI
ncbi:MAG: DUF5690 family protein [Bacteroidota bacterium]